MPLAQNDEQSLLAENLRRYLQRENEFEHRRARLSAKPPQRMALWPGLAEMGVIGAAFDEASGGYGGDARGVALVMSELGRGLAVEPYLQCAIVAGRVLQQIDDAAQREALCACVIGGESVCVLAHDAGSDPYAAPRLRAQAQGDGYRLDGSVQTVRNGDVADRFIVSAQLDRKTALFLLDRAQLELQTYRLIDGAGAADLYLRDLAVPATARLVLRADAQTVLHDALDWGLLGLGAEVAGIAETLNAATFEYLRTRKQFGVPIGSFQALQHRAADLYIAASEIDAMLQAAVDAMGTPASKRRSALLAAFKALADSCGRRIGHEAIQLHGGMGVSDELNVAHYGRRLAAIRAELGSADVHRRRFALLGEDVGAILTAREDDTARSWRAEVRRFVEQNLPADIGRKVARGLKLGKDDFVRWQQVLHRHGWFGCAWPQEYGGSGWNLTQQLLFAQESALCNAPAIVPYGVSMVGPVVYTFANDAQKRQHLPGILSSEVWWCQGYSEPGSGSDLASLRTFAERDGDHYVVNGSKMWTTEAHWADWMHCLVRTDRSGKPQTGISFLLIDMNTPGLEIKPIVTIDGIHHTNAVFFDNVRVPVENRVGEEGQGWTMAKFLLGNERIYIADTGPKLRLLTHVRGLHRKFIESPAHSDELKAALSLRLADVSIQLLALCMLERQYVDAWSAGAKPGAEASMLKIRGTEILQAISELALDLEGPLAAAHDPADLHRGPDETSSPAQQASIMAHEYLYARCWSVFGGTNEIQRNIIAKHVVGL
jgi:alkylation response protein AidB-like acyl-CoA dehydrogenase